MKKSEIIFGLLRIPVDFGMTICAWILAYKIRPYTDLIPSIHFQFSTEQLPDFPTFIKISFISALGLILLFAIGHLYTFKNTYKKSEEFRKIIFLVFTWIMFFMAYYFLIAHTLFFSRIVLAHTAVFATLFIIIGRIIIRFLQNFSMRLGVGQRNILLIGTNETSAELVNALNKMPAFKIIGTLTINLLKKKFIVPILGNLSDMKRIVKKNKIEEIWFTENKAEAEREVLEFCQTNHIGFRLIPDIKGIHYSHVDISFLSGLPILEVKPTPLEGWGKIIKRIYDVICAILGIIILSPFLLIIAISIKLESTGPIVYKSKRVGEKGKTFQMLKFRSMYKNADRQKAQLVKLNHRKGPLFKIKNDPRITSVGKFLRKTSLDELPQLWNVIKGNMSLVGPRPHLPEEVKNYEEWQKRTLTIKPGISGLAQTSGRSDLEFENEVKLDLAYIENWSVFLDIKIILKTIAVIVGGKGAD